MTRRTRYLEPGWFTRNVFNRTVRRLTRMGLSVMGHATCGCVAARAASGARPRSTC